MFKKKLSIIMSVAFGTFALHCGAFAAPSSFGVSSGEIRAEIGKKGIVQFYRVPLEGGSSRALLAESETSPSFLSVFVGKREFRSTAAGVKIEISGNEERCELTFSSPKHFSSSILFRKAETDSIWAINANGDAPSCIRADFSIKNLSGERQQFSARTFFDTVLGDNASIQFDSAAGTEFKSEYQLSSYELKKETGLRSLDGTVFLGFSFSDFPTSSTMANRDVLLREISRSNEVRSEKGRSFSSASSYLNSSIAFSWDGIVLENGEEKTLSFFVSAGGLKRGERTIIRYIDVPAPKNEDDEENARENNAPSPKNNEPLPVPVSAPNPPLQEAEEDETEENQGADFDVSNLRDYQLDPAYVQALIDRINSLRSGSESPIDRDEIVRLNAELDAILEKLRQERK